MNLPKPAVASAATSRKRTRKAPDDRRLEIIIAARALLAENGYAEFSLRKIGMRCGIGMSAIQHYFPARADLIEAMTDHVIDEYVELYSRFLYGSGIAPEQRLTRLIELLLDQNDVAETMGFFYELWAFSFRDPSASASLRRMEQHIVGIAGSAVRALNPALTETQASERAILILSAVDGLAIMVGSRRKLPAKVSKAFRRNLTASLLGIATAN